VYSWLDDMVEMAGFLGDEKKGRGLMEECRHLNTA
jgi:hypothetical protein